MLKILDYNEGMLSLCLSNDNEWLIKSHNGECYLSNDGCILYLLPLLEIDYDDFSNKIREYHLSDDIIGAFPLASLLMYPFNNQRQFWAELALDWIEKSGKSQELNLWAYSIKRDWMPQKLMHRFRKVLGLPKGWDKVGRMVSEVVIKDHNF